MKKRLVSIILTAAMLAIFTPTVTFATTSGTCGGKLTWVLENGTLTISGTGDMDDYSSSSSDYAPWFYNRISIKKIVIESNVTSIGKYAFYKCSNLTSIDMPSSVTSIGNAAFASCSSLASIEIPDSVTSIGSNSFYSTAYYNNTDNWVDGVLYIGKHLIDVDSSELKEEYEIKSGTLTIADGAFYNCSSLTNIEIPDSVTSIGDYAFKDCSGLTNIEIPDSVTSIGNRIFYCCGNLTSVELSDNVTSIGNYAFYGCSLTSIEVPRGVTSIGNYAFGECSELTSIELSSGVKSIGSYAFYRCSKLTSITLPIGVTSIGSDAFYACTGLTSVEIPSGVTSIGDSAFTYCWSLTSIEIPGSVTSINYNTFYACTGLTSVEILDGVTSIGLDAFQYCSSLTSITIPDSVTSIGEYAFEHCSSLTSITIPDSVTSIGDYAFYYTAYYKDGDNWESGALYIGNHLIKANVSETYEIKSGTLTIADYAFYGCSSLTSIAIPNSVTSIGFRTFMYCYSLTNIEIPDSVTSIGEYAFYYCSSLTSIEILSRVASIGNNAFENTAYYNDEDNWVDGVLYIGKHLIEADSSKLNEEYEIKSGTLTIADLAFYYCSSLTSVEIPNSITSIGDSAFYYCRSLTSIEIPSNVTSIGSSAFYNCSSLTSVTIPDSVTSIGDGAFSDCSSLTSVTIPDSVTSIGDAAFDDCDSLTSITIPNNVTSIGDAAFWQCRNLTNIEISNSVTSIGDETFMYCYSLTNIEIPDSVTSIGDETFYKCSDLISITIPDSVTNIGEDSFYHCGCLTDVYYSGSEEEWAAIDIDSGNTCLTSATIHYSSTGADDDDNTDDTDTTPTPLPTVDIPDLPDILTVESRYPLRNTPTNLWNDLIIDCYLEFDSEVTVGNGKIYLMSYSTDELCKTLDTDEFGCDGNKLSFSLVIGQDVQCGKMYYVLIDSDAIVSTDGSVFEGITEKNDWYFTTSYGLNKQDVLGFSNTVSAFFTDYDEETGEFPTKRNTVPLASSELKDKIISIIGKSDYKSQTKKKKEFKGVCFGLSLVTLLYNSDKLDISVFDSNASTLNELTTPVNSVEAYGVRDLICYYQLLQTKLADGLNTNDVAWAKFWGNGIKEDALEQLVTDAANISSNKKPFLLTIGYSDKASNDNYLHALIVVSERYNSDTDCYEILYKNPNTLGVGTALGVLKVASDFSSITYDSAYDVVLFKELTVDEISEDYLIGAPADTSSVSLTQTDEDYDYVRAVAFGDFTITNAEGETIVFEDNEISGDMEIADMDFMDSGIDNILEFVFKVSPSDSYSFTSSDSRSVCTVKNGETLISADVQNSSEITIGKQSGVSISGSDISYDVTLTSATEENMFTLSGSETGALNVSLNEDGTAYVTADTLQNVEFESLYEDKAYTFSSDSDSVDIVNTDDGGLTVDNADVAQATTFSISAADNGNGVDISFINNTQYAQTGKAIIAEYDKTGALIQVFTYDLELTANKKHTVSYTDACVYKAFVWDSLNSMIPLAQYAEFTAE